MTNGLPVALSRAVEVILQTLRTPTMKGGLTLAVGAIAPTAFRAAPVRSGEKSLVFTPRSIPMGILGSASDDDLGLIEPGAARYQSAVADLHQRLTVSPISRCSNSPAGWPPGNSSMDSVRAGSRWTDDPSRGRSRGGVRSRTRQTSHGWMCCLPPTWTFQVGKLEMNYVLGATHRLRGCYREGNRAVSGDGAQSHT